MSGSKRAGETIAKTVQSEPLPLRRLSAFYVKITLPPAPAPPPGPVPTAKPDLDKMQTPRKTQAAAVLQVEPNPLPIATEVPEGTPSLAELGEMVSPLNNWY